MPLRCCTYLDCQRAADRQNGSCMICGQHWCGEHGLFPFHTCPTEDDDPDAYYEAYDAAKKQHLDKLLVQIDCKALAGIASQLRQGIKCRIPAFEEKAPDAIVAASQMGGQNCHADIKFDDGVTWLGRLHLEDPVMAPATVQAFIFESEVQTLKFLETTKIPAPHIYYHAVKGPKNPVGVTFMLVEKLEGHALDWNSADSNQRHKIMEQLVDIQLEIAKHPFSASGSLKVMANKFDVGSYAQVALFSNPDCSLGPFEDLASALDAVIKQQLEGITSGELAAFPIDSYLTYLWRLNYVPSLVALNTLPKGFYLKHNDDKGDHIFIDDDFNIVGLIDWEFATLEPAGHAFSTPCMMWDVGAFFEGSNDLTPEEKAFAEMFERRQRPDLATCVRHSRAYQRFVYFLASVGYDQAEFEALFQGLRSALGSLSHSYQISQEPHNYEGWKAWALKQYGEDQGLKQLLRRSSKRSRTPGPN